MQVRSLEAFGLAPALLEVCARHYGADLLPAQERAFTTTALLRGGSLLVFAPTGAGKTLIGEVAALRAATRGQRALYLVPTRALAEEKYAALSAAWSELGLRVLISTRDRRADDERLLRGDFDLAVAVPEKAHYLLNLSPGLAPGLGTVVVDELQLLGDPERGPVLEITLAHLRRLHPELQLVGLSAVVGDPGGLAAWLGAECLEIHERPVELRRGVLAGGRFLYRDYNTGQSDAEELAVPAVEGDWEESAALLALEFAQRGEPTLVFLPDRQAVVRLASRLAEETPAPPAAQALAALEYLPPTLVRSRLREMLAAGVGFHSADLQFEERRIVEQAFAAGEFPLLCSTSTLALGVNLPARNVILGGERWQKAGGRAVLVPLSRAEFENMGGRAGRPGLSEDFGRSLLLADSAYQQEMLLERYTQPGFEPLAPALGGLSPLGQLALLCGSAGSDLTGLNDLYRCTLTAYANGEQHAPELPASLQAAVGSALRHGLLAEREPEGLRVTPQGRLAATSGASLETFYWLTRGVGAAVRPPGETATTNPTLPGIGPGTGYPTPPGDLALLYLAATTAEALALAPPLGDWEARRHDWLAELREAGGPEDALLIAALQAAPELALAEKARAARLALILLRWSSDEPTADLEQAVQVPAGRLTVAGETLSWLVQLAGQIGAEAGWPLARVQEIQRWATRLGAGLPPEALPLHRALPQVRGRDTILALLARGLRTAEDLRQLTVAEQRELLLPENDLSAPPRTAGARPAPRQRPRSPRALPRAGQAPPALRLDPGRPDRVLFHGTEVRLRPTEWRLLAALAAQPGRCLSYDQLYQALWGPDEVVEPGQIHWHRSKLAEKLQAALPPGEPRPLHTIPRRGYLLDLPPEQVECLPEAVPVG
ncbi:MAG TPA: DEAD/DEAH box helicase [Armatimonadota bacterium]|jgi:helicase